MEEARTELNKSKIKKSNKKKRLNNVKTHTHKWLFAKKKTKQNIIQTGKGQFALFHTTQDISLCQNNQKKKD